jgi:hypothetical protein
MGTDPLRSRAQLLVENALLRHQVVILRRSVKRPAATAADRALLVLLVGRVRAWHHALLIVRPETLLGWHRAGFRAVWRWKSRPGPGRPPLHAETVALLRRHPHLHSTLLDLPGAAVARRHLAEEPEGTRVEVVAGDFLRDPLPAGHDAIVLANVVHVFSPEHNRALFRRARTAATPEARLLIVDFLTDPMHTDPAFAALAAGEFLLIAGEGDVFSAEEPREGLGETGWRPLEHQPLGGPTSLLVAEAV